MENVLLIFTEARFWSLVLLVCSSICWVGMVTCESLSNEENGVSLKDNFFPGFVLDNIYPTGLLMCKKLCTRRTDCCGINFNTIQLTCLLLAPPCSENKMEMEYRRGYIYIFIGNSRNQPEKNQLQHSICFKSPGKSLVCMNVKRPRDCEDIPEKQRNNNGFYRIYPNPGQTFPINVQCHIHCNSTCDDQWTIIQRRFNGSQDFFKNWDEYKKGFGDTRGEYWIGNQALYEMTSRARYQLLVFLTDFDGREYYALYSQFSVRNESLRFLLTVDGYSGNAGDSLSIHSGMPFSTKDQDNEKDCANVCNGGWWYRSCYSANLNGRYLAHSTNDHRGLCWKGIHDTYYSFKECKMMIKRK